ncbi:MAG: zinc ribbon domain-containing protein [Candidatus Bathyarchaeia archaeon]
MSSFLKKRIRVDKNLANILGFEEGSLISYAKMIKMIREYLKKHELIFEEEAESVGLKYCFKCGSPIDLGAKFCYKCGIKLK